MKLFRQYNWIEPLELSKKVSQQEKYWCLLYSGNISKSRKAKSYLAFSVNEKISSDHIYNFLNNKQFSNNTYENMWFGYLGYGLKNYIKDLNIDNSIEENSSIIEVANLFFMKFNNIIEFDHEVKLVNAYSQNKNHGDILKLFSNEFSNNIVDNSGLENIRVNRLESNMTKDEYIEKVEYIIDEIKKGTLYQANLTRKFYGNLHTDSKRQDNNNGLDLFIKLCHLSPSPYSCYFKIDNVDIISSSPEQFIKSDDKGNVVTTPIKGTAPRGEDTNADNIAIQNLENSEKDKAENLMIVDLMRNDFAKGCKKSSISVDNLFKITSYKSVHHMSSEIKGKVKTGINPLKFIENCFPPGSMTGTPKIKAMEICSDIEGINRGVYSGCIGWISENGSFDTSVVIRTLIIKDNIFEFQVGGAIVYDSEPKKEWLETMYKARDICDCLGISSDKLMSI